MIQGGSRIRLSHMFVKLTSNIQLAVYSIKNRPAHSTLFLFVRLQNWFKASHKHTLDCSVSLQHHLTFVASDFGSSRVAVHMITTK